MFDLLRDLLTGRNAPILADGSLPGAELVVQEDGVEVFRAALARHARRDPEDAAVIWLRPLAQPRREPGTGLPAFDPGVVRRRALHVVGERVRDGQLVLDLGTGQRAIVRPATAGQLELLQDWDTWMATLPEAEQADLDALDHD